MEGATVSGIVKVVVSKYFIEKEMSYKFGKIHDKYLPGNLYLVKLQLKHLHLNNSMNDCEHVFSCSIIQTILST